MYVALVLVGTGVDWVLFDWTNNIPCVERCTAQPCMCVGRSDLQMVVDSALALVDYQVERKRAGLPYLRHATFIGTTCTHSSLEVFLNNIVASLLLMIMTDTTRHTLEYLLG